MIKIENLVKIYDNGFKAVNNISLEVKKGEIFGIIGMSGAGKSSLIRCINRLEEPTQGNIFIDGKDIVKMNSKELKEARKNMAMIFQSFNLFYQKNVFENIAYPLRINKWKKKDIEERVNTLLEYVNLKEKIYEKIFIEKPIVHNVEALKDGLERLDKVKNTLDKKEITDILKDMVPTFKPDLLNK